MCGIVGIYLKNKKYNSQLGKFLTGMMNSMATRGPDSSGFAIYSSEIKKKYKYSVCSNTDQVKEISKKLSKHVKDIKVKSISDHLIIETAMKPKKFIEILKIHTVTIRDYKDFIKLVGIKNNYTIKELKHFLGY